MIPLSLNQIAKITAGRVADVDERDAAGSDEASLVTGFVEFDSRKVTPGGLFVALPGATVDGHDFAQVALDKGAVGVLAAREVGVPAVIVPPVQRRGDDNSDLATNDPDGSASAVVEGMSKLAQYVAHELTTHGELTITGVTGSAGKTSTKDLIAAVLSRAGETVAPPGSFNNEIGHPYTVLRCSERTKFLVAEMSARGIGHIAHLASIAPPRIGVVLNVGTAHLGEFGSRENIAQAKGELVEALPTVNDGGVAVLNADDPFVAAMASRTQARVVRYSAATPVAADADYFATNIELDDVARASFDLHTPNNPPHHVRLGVFGLHQVSNALAAAAVGIECGMSAADVAEALSSARSASANRMDLQTRTDGVTIINDAYNANPESMRAGIAALGFTAAARPGARSIAVLGEMGELGNNSVDEHTALADELARYRVTDLIAVGDNPATQALSSAAAGRGVRVQLVPDVKQATAAVKGIISTAPPGEENWHAREDKDVILVKASNALGLWRIAETLLENETRNSR